MTRRQVATRLLRLLRPMAPMMTVSATARIFNQGLGVAIPAVAAGLVVTIGSGSGVGALAVLLIVMALVKGTCRYVEQFTGHAVAFRLLAQLRVDTYRKIVPLAPAGLEDDRTGDLVSRVIGDIDRVEPFYAHTIAPMASALFVPLLAAVGLAVWVDPVVALVFLPFPLMIALVAPWIDARRGASVSTRAREEAGETAAVFTDSIQGAREVAVFNAQDTVTERVESRSNETADLGRKLARISATRSFWSDLLAGAAVVAVTALAVYRFGAGQLDLTALAVSIVVSWAGTTPARAVEGIVADVDQALAAAGRLFELSDREPPVPEADPPGFRASNGALSAHLMRESGPVDGPVDGSVAFRDVSLAFPRSGREALSGVDLGIAEGSMVAVVGPSGAGKSTLVELLVRFRDPDTGMVEVGGVDVAHIDSSELRRTVAMVPQRPEIFFGTIGDNLRLAKPDATDDELLEALDRAALGKWVRSLDRGLETTTGELGETLSGGQRQRLAITRAFLRDPRVMVLDEAMSELDPVSERRILDELSRQRGKRTLIVVAHRLDTVTDADEIVVLDRGRLVERGSHDTLVEANGVFAGLWQRHLDVAAVASGTAFER